MKQMGSDRDQDTTEKTSSTQPKELITRVGLESKNESSTVDKQLGRLVIDDTRSYYVSNKLWANLTNEIEELRDLLYDPTSDHEEGPNDDLNQAVPDSTLNMGSNAAILGFQTIAPSMRPYHPPLSQSVALVELFKERVLPLVHIFHAPTLMRDYWNAMASLNTLDRNSEALIFAIYYSTVISMESEQCESVIGVSRGVALRHYQFAVQQAMARADFLNTQSVTLLQAVVLFLSALRNVDASRRTWSLTALVFHIARAMGLHRDGTAFGLPPLETELRRRLWWHICFLDIRSSEYHGCQPIVQDSAFDTKMPLNIDDSDLVHGMTEPPIEREEATEMTFCLVRCEVLRVAWKTSYFFPSEMSSDERQEEKIPTNPEEMAKSLTEKLEERYIKHCDPSVPFLKLCMTVARLMINRIWLAIYYPPRQKPSSSLPAASRDKMFLTAISILEFSTILISSPEVAQWIWHSKTHIQWHAVVIVLAEICSRPSSPECDRAWECANTVYNRWNMQNDRANSLYRPINRLMAKAKSVRGTQINEEREAHPRTPGVASVTFNDLAEDMPSDFLLEPPEIFLSPDFLNEAHGDLESMYNDYTMGDWFADG
ncbi:unnamed protein product [Penicillium pancosmium]